MRDALFLLSYLSEVLQDGVRELPDHALQRDTTTASAAGCAFWRLERRIALQVLRLRAHLLGWLHCETGSGGRARTCVPRGGGLHLINSQTSYQLEHPGID